MGVEAVTYRYPWFASVFSAGHGERTSPGCGAQYSCVLPVMGHVPRK